MLKHSSKNLNLDGMLSTYAQKHICKSTPSKLGLIQGIDKMVDFCGAGKISLLTSIMSKLLHSKLIFSSGNYTRYCNVRP